MARQLGYNMLGGRRMARQVCEHGASLFQAGVAIGLAEHGLRAGLVHAWMVEKLATMVRIGGGRINGPTRNRLGEADDVGLAVIGADTERVQLEDFAREVFI